ncbi:MAG: T9SS type A sorting domain-containing protein [Bacteroidota bacterium]
MEARFSNLTELLRRGVSARVLSIIVLLLAAAPMLQAQPNLNLKRASVVWPTIELYFSVGCNGNPVYNMTKQDFRIFENGVEVKNFTLWCPDPSIHCSISVSLVFDASGSMGGAGNAGAKLAGHAFVDLMDGVIDEAAIIFFSQVVTIYQQMTTIKPMLHSAVDALPATGATAVWDGIYAGVIELINNGVNQCRAVIAMTDGGDNSSTRTVAEIIALANRHRIRVFTVGLGTGINATELEQIALLTGGRYYQTPNAGQLAAIYQEISQVLFQGFQECMITYDRGCADGGMRTVEVQLNNFCGGSDVKTKTYRAPLDSTTYAYRQFSLHDATVIGGSDVIVDLSIDNPGPVNLTPLIFTLNYPQQDLQLLSVTLPAGSPLAGNTILTFPAAGGTEVRVTDPWQTLQPDVILQFRFRSRIPPAPTDTILAPLSVSSAAFASGCLIPHFAPAAVHILRRGSDLSCQLLIPDVRSDSGSASYQPMPVPVTYELYNSGNLASDTIDVTLEVPAGLSLAAPDAPDKFTKRLQPPVLQPGGTGFVTWMLQSQPLQNETGYLLRARAIRAPGDLGLLCEDTLVIPPLDGLRLAPSCHIPDALHFDPSLQQYVPNPFTVRLTCVNSGTFPVRNVTGRIILPDGMQIDLPLQPELQTFSPTLMSPWKTGDYIPELRWNIRWDRIEQIAQYPEIRFEIAGEDTSGTALNPIGIFCTMYIPGILQDWTCDLELPDSLGRNANQTDVEPNPFTIRHTVTNRSIAPQRLSRVLLEYPQSDLVLGSSSPNSALVPLDTLLASGQSLTLEWRLRVPPRTTRRYTPINVTSYSDSTIISACEDWLHIASFKAAELDLACSGSDTIRFDAQTSTWLPDPYIARVDVRNLGALPATQVVAHMLASPFMIMAPGETLMKTVYPSPMPPWNPGDTTIPVFWSLRWVQPICRDTVIELEVMVSGTQIDGAPINLLSCKIPVYVEAPPVQVYPLEVIGDLVFCEGNTVVLKAEAGYERYRWSSGAITNSIIISQSGSYYCEISLGAGCSWMTDTVSVVVHPLPDKPTITRSLDILTSSDAPAYQWFRNGQEILVGSTGRSFQLTEEGSYRVRIENQFGCQAWSDPFDVTVLDVEDAPLAAADFTVHPNPSNGVVMLTFSGSPSGLIALRVTDVLGREVYQLDVNSVRQPLRVDLSGQPAGMYFIHVRRGDRSSIHTLQLRR